MKRQVFTGKWGFRTCFTEPSGGSPPVGDCGKESGEKLPDIMLGEQKNRRFARRPELAWLEQNLFRYGTDSAYTGEATDSIVFFQASNPSGEVSHIVHEIQRLVQEGKARYREIAVITGDLPGYGKEITHQFTQNQIPHFMDDKKNVT